jgi:hypothetical protein
VSEVYVVPFDLDPERIDPATGKPEEPIVMFDKADGSEFVKAADYPIEEEMYEYRQLRE